jgi:RsiW-degrading membrane proteinase PrsW (M82 family)
MSNRGRLETVARFLLIAGTIGMLLFLGLVVMANLYEGEPPGPSPLGMAIFTLFLGLPSALFLVLGTVLALVDVVKRRLSRR